MVVVGLGTQDIFDDVRSFVARYGTTFRMLWDPTAESWRALRITAQPAAMLLDRSGAKVKLWFGRFDEQEVLELAGT
ncbi:MAG: peroxiredoxin family protein [Actinomycetota bacterium]